MKVLNAHPWAQFRFGSRLNKVRKSTTKWHYKWQWHVNQRNRKPISMEVDTDVSYGKAGLNNVLWVNYYRRNNFLEYITSWWRKRLVLVYKWGAQNRRKKLYQYFKDCLKKVRCWVERNRWGKKRNWFKKIAFHRWKLFPTAIYDVNSQGF